MFGEILMINLCDNLHSETPYTRIRTFHTINLNIKKVQKYFDILIPSSFLRSEKEDLAYYILIDYSTRRDWQNI